MVNNDYSTRPRRECIMELNKYILHNAIMANNSYYYRVYRFAGGGK